MSAVLAPALAEALDMLERDARLAFDVFGKKTVEQLATAWQEEEPAFYARFVALTAISKAATRALSGEAESRAAGPYRFPNVDCSACGNSFGPGDNGFSHCRNHKDLRAVR